MDPVKEYEIENSQWLTRGFNLLHEEEFAEWLNHRDIGIVTQAHHEEFAHQHTDYWQHVADTMNQRYEE